MLNLKNVELLVDTPDVRIEQTTLFANLTNPLRKKKMQDSQKRDQRKTKTLTQKRNWNISLSYKK